ncbi:hypothetical protein [Isoptericola croceus]|uniref:hypothetical protein n=1 Tax=Isoptericola croceus TaxID=3031406 RepID=UPI0023F7FF86|nr:hypothetical protein [Isoptericola croceus]
MWPAIFTFLGGIAIALLSRIPALTRDGRRVARIKGDAELLTTLPDGRGRDALRGALDHEVRVLLGMREAERRFARSTRLSMTVTLVATILVVSVALLIPATRDGGWLDDESLVVPVVAALYGVLIATGAMVLRARYDARLEAKVRQRFSAGVDERR